MKDKTENFTSPVKPRRAAIAGGLAVIASVLLAFNPFKSTVKKTEKIKMLTEDGKLVEVDASIITTSGKIRITNKELQEWIKEK
jgi:hypothetical protein